jgi:outer membrane autotransporter protein
VTGQFQTVTDNFTNIDTIVKYNPNTAVIGLVRNDVVIKETPDLSHNQESTAGAIDELGPKSPIHQNVIIAGEENAGRSLDALSGEIHADVASALITGERIARGVMSDNIRNRVRDSDSSLTRSAPAQTYTDSKSGITTEIPGQKEPYQSHFALWAEAVADDLTLDDNGNAAKTEQNLAGIFVGANMSLGGGWESAIAYGYTSGDVDVDDRSSSAEIENNILGLTVGKSWDTGDNAINFLFGGTYTRSSIETERDVHVGNINETLTADYDANIFQLFTEVAYEIKVGKRSILEPFIGLGWATLDGDDYQEKGGISALHGDGISADQFNSIVGLRFRQGFDAGPLPAWVQASVGWEHNYGDYEGVAVNSFNGGGGFNIEGAEMDRDAAVLDLGIGVNLTESLSIGTSYIGRFSENNRENTYRLNLNYKF